MRTLESVLPAVGASVGRPRVKGKFLFTDNEKVYVRGVTYGTFRGAEEGSLFPEAEVVEQDFAAMAEQSINAIRTYTTPPRWLLDLAQGHGLYVLVGLAWEQHIAFLDEPGRVRIIRHSVREAVRQCAGHPAVLCYSIGNEIPAPIVRWYGNRKIEQFLEDLYRVVKEEDPDSLVTYINYPTTEYLQLPFIDLVCFNVYLETPDRFESYLARLQNIAGDRPLLMTEIGLDSRRNGEEAQATSLDWQVRGSFASGCAGAFVFAWTDEWYRGGHDIGDWDFGLTRRDRTPKPALDRVRRAFAEVPFPPDLPWPRISVVVCSYNGARTILDCLEALTRLDYPDFEVIVINDGSTDATAAIAGQYDFRLISTENRGLSNARNRGMEEAAGEIVAYIDDDAYPDPHWLTYLAATFLKGDYAGVGGPNIAPPGDGLIADCVANSPGAPVHVLLSDQMAEHIPGCNMAFRRSALQSVGGFDPIYRAAGDDVDLCWRLQDRGLTIGFSPAALDWHHRRNSLHAYWKQQVGYGKAEALLEHKWPERYNSAGHLSWTGRLYGKGLTRALAWGRERIYHGHGGSALFQSLYQPSPGTITSLSLMPEWYLVLLILAGFSLIGLLWQPLLLALPLLALAAAAMLSQAVLSAGRASFTSNPATSWARLKLQSLTALLHLVQPLARLTGRLRHGLTPWRQCRTYRLGLPWPGRATLWSESWCSFEYWLAWMHQSLKDYGAVVLPGGEYDRWDLEVRGGLLGSTRISMTVEEHGSGRQLLRFRWWPRISRLGLGMLVVLVSLAVLALLDRALIAGGILAVLTVLLAVRSGMESGSGAATLSRRIRNLEREP